jgi:hypothetical protein
MNELLNKQLISNAFVPMMIEFPGIAAIADEAIIISINILTSKTVITLVFFTQLPPNAANHLLKVWRKSVSVWSRTFRAMET